MKTLWIALLAGILSFSAMADEVLSAENIGNETLSNKHESGVELPLEDEIFGSFSIEPLAGDMAGLSDMELLNRRRPPRTGPPRTRPPRRYPRPTPRPPSRGSYYDWGRGRNGYGYCYEYTHDGRVLNGGSPVSNYYCESRHSSVYDWGRGRNGYGYCYQYTPYRVVMNEGSPVSNYYCEQRRPSYYSWGRGQNGNTYCYQYTADGVVMNEAKPVANYYCQRR